MQILVQHMIQNSETGNVEGYRDVAMVDASICGAIEEALEYAYRYTNNVMGSWSIKEQWFPTRDGGMMENGDYNDDVTVLHHRPDGMGQRSTMMGDRMVLNGTTYRVALAGFKEVEMVG